MQNEVKETEKYKLYKSVREILHPSISKRNISNYKIILKEELLPIKVFYPKKVTDLDKAIIYIQGYSKVTSPKDGYSKLLSSLAKDLDRMIISIDYNEEDSYDNQIEAISKLFDYLYSGLNTNGIEAKDIILMGDSTGSTLILNIINEMKIDELDKMKLALFYPALLDSSIKIDPSPIDYEIITGLKKYYERIIGKEKITPKDIIKKEKESIPNTTIICGNVDPLLDEVKKLTEKYSDIELNLISFASHNFLHSKDKEIKKEYKKILLSLI